MRPRFVLAGSMLSLFVGVAALYFGTAYTNEFEEIGNDWIVLGPDNDSVGYEVRFRNKSEHPAKNVKILTRVTGLINGKQCDIDNVETRTSVASGEELGATFYLSKVFVQTSGLEIESVYYCVARDASPYISYEQLFTRGRALSGSYRKTYLEQHPSDQKGLAETEKWAADVVRGEGRSWNYEETCKVNWETAEPCVRARSVGANTK